MTQELNDKVLIQIDEAIQEYNQGLNEKMLDDENLDEFLERINDL